MRVYVDTSVFYAAVDSADVSNEKTKRVLAKKADFVTSQFVFLETWQLIRSRIGWSTAEGFWGNLRHSAVTIEPIMPVDLDTARDIGQSFGDQEFSLADRTSFAVMERLSIAKVATLDKDFAVYRFGPKLERAFEIIR